MSQRAWGKALFQAFDLAKLPFLLFYLLPLLLLCTNTALGLADPDYFWHVKTGEVIVEMRGIPTSDPFSHSAADRPVTPEAWLSQVLLYLLYDKLGDYGVIVVLALLTASAWFCSFQSARIFLASPLSALVAALVFAPGILLFLTPRPQLFSFFFFALCLNRLLAAKFRNSWRPLLVLPVLMALWVNMHGAFVLGPLLILAFLLAEGASGFAPQGSAYRRRALWLSLALPASLAACFINPQGPGVLLHSFQLLGLESNQAVSEWQALRLDEPFGFIALLSVLFFFSMMAYRRRPPDLLELALPVSLMIAGLTTLRYYPFTALTLIPFLAQAFAEGAGGRLLEGPFAFLRPLLCSLKTYWERWSAAQSQAPRRGPYLVHWLALFLVVFLITPLLLRFVWSPEERDRRLPVAAADFVVAENIQGKMLNSYDIGGYLLYRFYPERKVFIDPRSGHYGDAFVKDYLTLIRAEEGWRRILEDYDIDYAIIKKSEPLRQALRREGLFAEVYKDKSYAVLLRKEAAGALEHDQ